MQKFHYNINNNNNNNNNKQETFIMIKLMNQSKIQCLIQYHYM